MLRHAYAAAYRHVSPCLRCFARLTALYATLRDASYVAAIAAAVLPRRRPIFATLSMIHARKTLLVAYCFHLFFFSR